VLRSLAGEPALVEAHPLHARGATVGIAARLERRNQAIAPNARDAPAAAKPAEREVRPVDPRLRRKPEWRESLGKGGVQSA
jgi:hypothetical protein